MAEKNNEGSVVRTLPFLVGYLMANMYVLPLKMITI